jgi:uracil-DNA glycosylase
LLNRTLTVTPSKSGSHEKLKWHLLTEKVVQHVAENNAVGLLWGNQAITLKKYFAEQSVITSAHPSPLSSYRGFFGSKPFSTVNSKLIEKGLTPIKW